VVLARDVFGLDACELVFFERQVVALDPNSTFESVWNLLLRVIQISEDSALGRLTGCRLSWTRR